MITAILVIIFAMALFVSAALIPIIRPEGGAFRRSHGEGGRRRPF